jgi:glycogen(starch) synthase
MERLLHTLCEEFVRQGHSVDVVTETTGTIAASYPIRHRPSTREYLAIARQADVILSAPLSLRRLGPQLASRRPVCVAHPLVPLIVYPGIPFRAWRRLVIPHAIKRLAAFLVTNIVPSRHMARAFPRAVVIPNPFDAAVFNRDGAEQRGRNILFAGRLIVEKGCDILLRAFAQISAAYPEVCLTVAGDGPKRAEIEAMAVQLGVADRVRFTGNIAPDALAAEMRAHGALVVPSLWEEPFGIVALEGLACGCAVVVSRVGGLPDAVGECGLMFERGDVDGLARCLRQVLDGTWKPGRSPRICRRTSRPRSLSNISRRSARPWRAADPPDQARNARQPRGVRRCLAWCGSAVARKHGDSHVELGAAMPCSTMLGPKNVLAICQTV